jgi:AGZA family xanthine/uracil permease-like MFS transporter
VPLAKTRRDECEAIIFRLSENQTTARTELLAGVTTFLTMAYIIVVQPAVLSGVMFGMPTGHGFRRGHDGDVPLGRAGHRSWRCYARYPIAQAPGMGENFFFVFSAIPAATAAGFANGWQVALGAVFISGVCFLILSLVGLREMIFNAVSPSLKWHRRRHRPVHRVHRTAKRRLIIKDPGTAVKLNAHFASPDLIVFLCRPAGHGGAARAQSARLDSLGHRRRHRR